ncbi:MAG: hypothetical protein JRE61_10305 [Deltaproteobacteria bacterium]|nr:hypothetical protein [Deltaproteobacteria bacterium]
MKIHHQFIHRLNDQKGVSAVIVAIVLPVLIGCAALAIDIGYLYATKNELQNIADAAALAGANEIGNQWFNGETLNVGDVKFQIQDVASKNQAAEKYGISILDAEMVIGSYDQDATTKIGPQTGTWPTAVRVIARRTEGANGAIATFFAKILNIDTVGVAADATAALTGQASAYEGDLLIPVGISNYWYDPSHWTDKGFCDQPIKFSPTGDIAGCAGWHIYGDMESNPNPPTLNQILEGLTDGSFVPPAAEAGDSDFAYTGGNLSTSTFPNLQALFDHFKTQVYNAGQPIPLYYDATDNNKLIRTWADPPEEVNLANPNHLPVLDKEDGIDTPKDLYDWEVRVVVYNYPDCSNPNEVIEVVGFATAVLHAVNDSNDVPGNTVFAEVLCDRIGGGRGGGGNYGTLGSIAGLVE